MGMEVKIEKGLSAAKLTKRLEILQIHIEVRDMFLIVLLIA